MTTTSMIQPKFLSKGDQLGVVAVGFSAGQVRKTFI
jgi:arginase